MTNWQIIHGSPAEITVLCDDKNVCSVLYHENGMMSWKDPAGAKYQPQGKVPAFVWNAIILRFNRMFMLSPKQRFGSQEVINVQEK